MVFNTLTVGAAVAPRVIETAMAHYMNRKPRRGKPTAHISYDEGLHLIRQFLVYASNHTVENMQGFTAQWVPSPHWVRTEDFNIPEEFITSAASALINQLGPKGLEAVGGTKWWQWRPEKHPFKAEWIEMRKEHNALKAAHKEATRIILYVHGGAYYFGSVDEHRYQLQRHARKLKARLLAPRYRLAPQFPFPCGLQDCLAAYLWLLKHYDASSIILAGDSAGGGMTMALLITLRDQGIPLPAGALLLSPWVDLTHSFPSVGGDGNFDYIPADGFHHRPSASWPPPNSEEMRDLKVGKPERTGKLHKRSPAEEKTEEEDVVGVRVEPEPAANGVATEDHAASQAAEAHPSQGAKKHTVPGAGPNLSLDLDGNRVEILDQIQMYTTNQLLTHPLVSPVMCPSLGGLPPLLIQTGGGELLCDEQVYLAHKAAHPAMYHAPDAILDIYDPERKMQDKYPPTKVQLQVWEDLCHVPHTLSFTRPAKHMYRAVAQFGNWCYANAAKDTAQEEVADDDASIISSDTDTDSDDLNRTSTVKTQTGTLNGAARDTPWSNGTLAPTGPSQSAQPAPGGAPQGTVAANDPLPPFEDHMIRQFVDRHGIIFPLAPAASLAGCTMHRASIGVIKPVTVRKWLAKKESWDRKYASAKRRAQQRRAAEIKAGYHAFIGDDGMEETPPPTALAGRIKKGAKETDMPNLVASNSKKKRSLGLALWSGWGSKHDSTTVDAEQRGGLPRRTSSARGQAPAVAAMAPAATAALDVPAPGEVPGPREGEKLSHTDNAFLAPGSARPHDGSGVAYPFKLRGDLEERSASMHTLQEEAGVVHEVEGAADADPATKAETQKES